ncbi:MAG: DUF6569 family protein, partial [Hyphomicrobium sp.]
ATAETGSATAAPAERISGPHVHENLAIYFVHGPSAPGAVPLTLAEALDNAAVEVRETGTVNTLEIENTSDHDVYIQSGDIVKGGKQDRVLTMSLLLPPKSGRVPIGSFCVEQGRWAARGKEDVKAFTSAREAMPSREAKLAMNRPKVAPAPLPVAGRGPVQQGRVPSYTEQQTANAAQQRGDTLSGAAQQRGDTLSGAAQQRGDTLSGAAQQRGDYASGSSRQSDVWAEVAKTQAKLAAGLTTASVAAPESKSSLQLTLEHQKLKEARAAYLAALSGAAKAEGDIVGYVFAVNGKLNSADIYPSNGLFQKMWPKLLNASITEAIGERSASEAKAAAPVPTAVQTFLDAAEKGKSQENAFGKLMKQEIREADAALYVEARKASGGFVHRNYIAK